eukprot:jgi/Phyca11/106435/e_gw1.12.217.1
MLKLFCVVVGVAGDAFPVNIEPNETVGDMKKKIKHEEMYQFPASELQLFLAKVPKEKHDMAWLSSRSEDVKKLKKGEKTPLIDILTEEDQELQAEDPLDDVLRGMDPPSLCQIHVLVMAPPQDSLRSHLTTLLSVLLCHVLTKAPTTPTDRNVDFKDDVCNFYGCYSPDESCVRCMLLNDAFPSELVVASHLFRCSNEDVSDVMMQITLSDIDDERNGLLLFKPLKYAFDHFQISFIRDDTDVFRLKVFDPSILATPIVDLKDRKGNKVLSTEQTQLLLSRISENPCRFNTQTTFGDVDDSALTFTGLERPFYRCLNLQARVARVMALEKKWIDASYDFQDFWSEVSLDDKMEMFHRSILNS